MKFNLPQNFVDSYRDIRPPFGYDGLGEFVFYRTYSRIKEDGTNESWVDVIERVVNETYTIQLRHAKENNIKWDEAKADRSAMEMFDRIFNLKFVPPGRGLWAMGSPVTKDRGIYMALQNCAFVSTENIGESAADSTKPFTFLMDVSMLGVGCGFDTKGEGKIMIQQPVHFLSQTFVIEDSREGWLQSVDILLRGYFIGGAVPTFDYSQIRPKGEPIKGFGGVASGPEPLMNFHRQIREQFKGRSGELITSRDIVDIMNKIGQMVVAGNVRRTAELALGRIDDEEYLDLKNYEKNPERGEYGWTSNNSVLVGIGDDYSAAAERTKINGEPGYVWLHNARAFGRMVDPPDFADHRVAGFNPCVEQPLEPFEVCTLVETFPANHDSPEDYLRTLKFAFLYAKTVTLAPIHWPETQEIVKRNRRIGTSMTGVVQAIEKFGPKTFQYLVEEGFKEIRNWDRMYSKWLKVNESIRVTTVKPSGTTSLLAGATPGVHYPESEYYIRRVRVAKNSPLLQPIIDAGYHVEDSVDDPKYTSVVSFPVHVPNATKTLETVSMIDQLELAAFMQRYWSDNGVSVTITFKPEEASGIYGALKYYEDKLKAVSFLPKTETGAYAQMPYEAITQEEYEHMLTHQQLDFSALIGVEAVGSKFCTNDVCEIG